MIEKKSIIDQIEVTRDGSIQLRIALILEEDGVELDSKWHRTRIEPGGDIDAQMEIVNLHLISMGKAPVNVADLAPVRQIASLIQTPKVVSDYQAKVAAAQNDDEAIVLKGNASIFSRN